MNYVSDSLEKAKVITPPLNHDGIHHCGYWTVQHTQSYGSRSFFVIFVNEQNIIQQCSCKKQLACVHMQILCNYTSGAIRFPSEEMQQLSNGAPIVSITKEEKPQSSKLIIPRRRSKNLQSRALETLMASIKKNDPEVISISSSSEEE
jgi:hypothetical protein